MMGCNPQQHFKVQQISSVKHVPRQSPPLLRNRCAPEYRVNKSLAERMLRDDVAAWWFG